MTRVSTTILIALLLMNGTVGIMEASGLSEDLGVNLAPGVSETMDEMVTNARDAINPSSGFGETLFSLFISGVKLLETFMVGVFAAPSMLINLGFPAWFVIPVTSPLYVIGSLEIMYAATGRDMV
jgi:hypothetical protein